MPWQAYFPTRVLRGRFVYYINICLCSNYDTICNRNIHEYVQIFNVTIYNMHLFLHMVPFNGIKEVLKLMSHFNITICSRKSFTPSFVELLGNETQNQQ